MQEADTEGIEYSPFRTKKKKGSSTYETRIFLKTRILKIYVRAFKDIRRTTVLFFHRSEKTGERWFLKSGQP